MSSLNLVRGFGLIALTCTFTLACGDDGSSETGAGSTGDATDSMTSMTSAGTSTTTAGTTDASTTMDTGPMTCLGAGEGAAAEGDACTSNSDCASGVCLLFNDTPVDPTATCGATPPNCETHVTATVKNLSDGMATSGANVAIVKALDAITNPTGATPLASGTSDADGKIDVTTSMAVSAPFGIIAIVTGGEFFTSATGVAAPDDSNAYEVGTGIHEFWGVPTADLTAWSEALADDAAIDASALPLGDEGGVIGLIRDGETGEPLEGATAAPADAGSSMIIRYLQDDGSFNDVSTGPSGIFVAIGVATTGEDFEIMADGKTGDGTAGSAGNVVFTLIVDAS